MEITKDALLRVIKATRLSLRMAEDMRNLLVCRSARTITDDIAGQLCDALFYMCHENLGSNQDFLMDSDTMRLLKSRMSDMEVAEAFMRLESFNGVRPPEPHTFSQEEFDANYEKVGGYRYKKPEVQENERI